MLEERKVYRLPGSWQLLWHAKYCPSPLLSDHLFQLFPLTGLERKRKSIHAEEESSSLEPRLPFLIQAVRGGGEVVEMCGWRDTESANCLIGHVDRQVMDVFNWG